MATGEFGRTPKVNPAGGRDHWPACWTSIFAGGGVQGGQVVGASDEIGGAPKDRPVTPAEIAATEYHLMGLDLETILPAQLGRIVVGMARQSYDLHSPGTERRLAGDVLPGGPGALRHVGGRVGVGAGAVGRGAAGRVGEPAEAGSGGGLMDLSGKYVVI